MHAQIYKEDDTVDINGMGTMPPKCCHGATEEECATWFSVLWASFGKPIG